jgi:hypothetical protein
MEMMVSAILKASGIDPDKVREDVTTYATGLAQKIASMDSALANLANEQSVISQRLEQLNQTYEALRVGQKILSDWLEEIAAGEGKHVTRS